MPANNVSGYADWSKVTFEVESIGAQFTLLTLSSVKVDELPTAATGFTVWVQTWGPSLVTPVNTSVDDAAANERMLFWAPNAGIAEVAVITAGQNQVAGYIWNVGTGGIAGPQIYLMCSI